MVYKLLNNIGGGEAFRNNATFAQFLKGKPTT